MVPHYVDSEVGRLGTALLHRPGPELARLTPRNRHAALFDTIPWVNRAQEEHDVFASVLRDHGVEVLYVGELLAETLAVAEARTELLDTVLAGPRLGDTLRQRVADHLAYLDPAALADVLIAGLAHEELRTGWSRPGGLVHRLMSHHDFLIDPLPNLLYTRDPSVWIRDQAAVMSLAAPVRQRESLLISAIYRHHPRFGGTKLIYEPWLEHIEGGDILLLAAGVLAVGVGERTTPAGVERLARQVFAADLAHTLLAVPVAAEPPLQLDTLCTMVDADTVLMYPHLADSLAAYTIIAGPDDEPQVDGPAPFLHAAADAMDIDALRVIDAGLDPLTAEREGWNGANNPLAIAPRCCVVFERNVETNIQLERAGIEVIPIPGSELVAGRGGPRALSCPLIREPV
ncbi:MAG TPA: arginine deiminase [Micromonosporaceae bacterium]|nr:arginine deiminase [Micromonosporaceae bacterium]